MKLSKIGRAIVITLVTLFVLALLGLLVTAANRDGSGYIGSLDNKLKRMDEEGLSATALAPIDIYGEEWREAAVICPGTPMDDIEKIYGVKPNELGIDGESVPTDENLVVVANVKGEKHVDHVKDANLCTAPLQGAFDSRAMMPLVKDQNGKWILAA